MHIQGTYFALKTETNSQGIYISVTCILKTLTLRIISSKAENLHTMQ